MRWRCIRGMYGWLLRGIPLFLWSKETLCVIAKEWVSLLAMDNEIKFAKRINEAWFRIQTQYMDDIDENIILKHGDQEYCIKVT